MLDKRRGTIISRLLAEDRMMTVFLLEKSSLSRDLIVAGLPEECSSVSKLDNDGLFAGEGQQSCPKTWS